MNRTSSTRGLTVALIIGALTIGALTMSAHAQTLVCKLGQKVCVNRCYSPLEGESCNEGGIVCKVGQKVCGTRCYSPLKGESCNIKTK